MKKRETELDILRLLALLSVMFVHSCGIISDWTALPELTNKALTFNLAVIMWEIPAFVMISGRFFLDPEKDITFKKIGKAIWRLILAFLAWNVVYQAYYILAGKYADLNWKGILSQALAGPYHFWYIYMTVCLYAIVPFLRKITQDKKLMEYFIVLFLIFEFLTRYGINLPFIGSTIGEILDSTYYHFTLGFSGYYILGYYLHKYRLTGKREIILYILGIFMAAFTGMATIWMTMRGAEGKEWFSKFLMPNIIIEAAAIYTFFVNRVSRIHYGERVTAMISKLSEYSFGAYLVHALILELFTGLGLGQIPAHPVIVITLTLVLDFIASIAVTALLRKISYIGKKIT